MGKKKQISVNGIKIGLMSPEQVRLQTWGKVVSPETISYRTGKPVKGGLFDERIFGPLKDNMCACGKMKGRQFRGKICDHCGVEVGDRSERRVRTGRIELLAPVVHIWYYKGQSPKLPLLLGVKAKDLEKVVKYSSYIVIEDKTDTYEVGDILEYDDYVRATCKWGERLRMGTGAEAIYEILHNMDLKQLFQDLLEKQATANKADKEKLAKRITLVNEFIHSGNKPEWMVLFNLIVTPPDTRPMLELDGGKYASSDLNDLYRAIIQSNIRLQTLVDKAAPSILINSEKRMLQEKVDALFDNGKLAKPRTGANGRPLKSLTQAISGKQGIFRQNLLGKRVDYSGRSVIVINPKISMDQCGVPKPIALEMFKPFVISELMAQGVCKTIKKAQLLINEGTNKAVWDALDKVMKGKCVLLNRAPTLHKLGIQAFHPILVEGNAIQLHPLVCTAFNADFDGDQMAIHLPLSAYAQEEAETRMLSTHNLLKPADGKPVTVPTQDMILGMYYLTLDKNGEKGEGKAYSSREEVELAYSRGFITLHSKIKMRIKYLVDDKYETKLIPVTLGKLIFNDAIPQDLGFVDRSKVENRGLLEVDFKVTKGVVGKIIDKCIQKHGFEQTVLMLDKIKALGYHYSTKSGITVSIADVQVPAKKVEIIEKADKEVQRITLQYMRGYWSNEERKSRINDIWNQATEDISNALIDNLDEFNNINMMADSGARGSTAQLKQLAGMRGLIANASGETIDIPIKSNYREGLSVLEYFISSRGARKGMADTALRTANSGYLTRRLVDVSQDLIVKEEDCGATKGIVVEDIYNVGNRLESVEERLVGRYLVKPFVYKGTTIMPTDRLITAEDAKRMVDTGERKFEVRSVLSCRCVEGVCQKCYGMSLSTGKLVPMGEAVGVIAAQSIGEPGTQLTMRTFHTGGIASTADITQGLPRVEELFENREPAMKGIMSELDGKVSITTIKNQKVITVTTEDGITDNYKLTYKDRVKVKDGQMVHKGEPMTEGSLYPTEILEILGEEAVWNYIIKEVQFVYRIQGVEINDKHIEVIVHQMLRKIVVEDSGDTYLQKGEEYPRNAFLAMLENLRKQKGKDFVLPTYRVAVRGITKAASSVDSFLSAASFQYAEQRLTEAAIRGKTDYLKGLKENVMIGTLIPAGTGLNAENKLEE